MPIGITEAQDIAKEISSGGDGSTQAMVGVLIFAVISLIGFMWRTGSKGISILASINQKMSEISTEHARHKEGTNKTLQYHEKKHERHEDRLDDHDKRINELSIKTSIFDK